ncbi:MAG: hypothetical protein HY940_03815 [Gammaproteobacteria bacterium]|nr:hypothetical protein [Gammaproteobacteria bacterium]
MTSVSYIAFGKKYFVTLSPAHILSSALDAFLQADNPGAEVRAITDLSIGMEIFVKKELHLIDPLLVKRKLKDDKLKVILSKVDQKAIVKAQRRVLLAEMAKLPQSNNVISFDQAIKLFRYFRRVPLEIIEAMNSLRYYRNGLFHWEADPANLFELSRRSLTLYLWLFEYLERKIGWHLGGEINILDPFARKRQQLRELQSLRRSERLFNAKRRMFKHHNDYGIFVRFNARLNGTITRPHGVKWPHQHCPACNNPTLQVEDWRNR